MNDIDIGWKGCNNLSHFKVCPFLAHPGPGTSLGSAVIIKFSRNWSVITSNKQRSCGHISVVSPVTRQIEKWVRGFCQIPESLTRMNGHQQHSPYRALAILEILYLIFSHDASPGNLASYARVCKAWLDPALDKLWEKLEKPTAAFQLLAPLKLDEKSYSQVWDISVHLCLTNIIYSMYHHRNSLEELQEMTGLVFNSTRGASSL